MFVSALVYLDHPITEGIFLWSLKEITGHWGGREGGGGGGVVVEGQDRRALIAPVQHWCKGSRIAISN